MKPEKNESKKENNTHKKNQEHIRILTIERVKLNVDNVRRYLLDLEEKARKRLHV